MTQIQNHNYLSIKQHPSQPGALSPPGKHRQWTASGFKWADPASQSFSQARPIVWNLNPVERGIP
jgi:hypothetical protein